MLYPKCRCLSPIAQQKSWAHRTRKENFHHGKTILLGFHGIPQSKAHVKPQPIKMSCKFLKNAPSHSNGERSVKDGWLGLTKERIIIWRIVCTKTCPKNQTRAKKPPKESNMPFRSMFISFSITILEGTSSSRLGSYVLYCLRCLRSLHPRPQTIYWNRSVPETWPRKMNGFSHPWRGYQGWAFAYYRNLFWSEKKKKHIKCACSKSKCTLLSSAPKKTDTKWCENSQ